MAPVIKTSKVNTKVLSAHEIAAWRKFGVATVSDAMEMLHLRRSVITGLRCTVTDVTAVGSALTIRQLVKHASSTHSQRLVRHPEILRTVAMPGQFIVLDAGGFEDLSSWGELHSKFSVELGLSGLLIDGCVRDAAKIRKAGFPVYCRGFTPIKSQWDYETVSVHEPVMIGRVQIRQGDIVIADEDGAIVVPVERATEVFDMALSIQAKEEASYS